MEAVTKVGDHPRGPDGNPGTDLDVANWKGARVLRLRERKAYALMRTKQETRVSTQVTAMRSVTKVESPRGLKRVSVCFFFCGVFVSAVSELVKEL